MSTRKRVWLSDPNLNYANRRCLLVDTAFINEDNRLYEEPDTHFNYGDFINAACISVCPMAVLNVQPNYMVIYNGDQIESRWYVMGVSYISGEVAENKSKWQMNLLRDVIVDNRELIKNSVMRINRGNQSNFPELIYKHDLMTFNEVKVDQKNIYDWAGQTQWLGIFYDAKASGAQLSLGTKGIPTVNYSENEIYQMVFEGGFYGSIEDGFKGIQLSVLNKLGTTFKCILGANPTGGRVEFQREIIADPYSNNPDTGEYNCITLKNEVTFAIPDNENIFTKAVRRNVARFNAATWWSQNKNIIAANQRNNTEAMNAFRRKIENSYIKLDTGRIVRPVFRESADVSYETIQIKKGDPYHELLMSLGESMMTDWEAVLGIVLVQQVDGAEIICQRRVVTQTLNFVDANNSGDISLELPRWSKTLDETYVRFCAIPLNINVVLNDTIITPQLSRETIAPLITQGFATAGEGDSSVIKDAVLLPYCPISALNLRNQGKSTQNLWFLDARNLEAQPNSTSLVYQGSEIIGIAFGETVSNYSTILKDALNIQSNRRERYYKKCRIKSPNHNSALDVNPAYNLGITDVRLSFSLRPLKTVYAVSPVWKGLYGSEYKDDRANITTGGMSFSQTTDVWANYQLQNSTYQEIFNSQIQSLEYDASTRLFMNNLTNDNAFGNSKITADAAMKKATLSNQVSAITGVQSTLISSASNPAALLSLGAAGMNYRANKAMADISHNASMAQAENNLAVGRQVAALNNSISNNQIQLARDQFNLTNTAIRSAPTILGRSGDLTTLTASKFYVEIYECMAFEKAFLEDFIKYNGELIEMFTQDVSQYIVNNWDYVEGFCVYVPGLTPQMTDAVNSELRRGRYYNLNIFKR